MKDINTRCKLFLFGILTSLMYAPLFVVFIPFFTFPYFYNKLKDSKNKKIAFFNSFIFCFGYFIGNLYWISVSLFTDIKTYWWLLPFVVSIVPATVATLFSILNTLFYIFKTKNEILNVLLFSLFWTLAEYLRNFTFLGLPWNSLVNATTFFSILLQPVSMINSYCYSFILLILFLSKEIYKTHFFKIILTIYCGLIVTSVIRVKSVDVVNKNINIRIVQPNIVQTLKWDRETERKNFDTLIDLSLSDGYENVNYFIWPESAITYLFYEKRDNSELLNELNDRLLKDEKFLVSGIISYDEKNIYNSLIAIKGNQVIDIYKKHFLVPFGEFIPFRKFLPFINKFTVGNMDFSRGEIAKNIKTKDFIFSPNICYESIFYKSINKNSDLIINITNDAWFGKSSGPFQHFEHLKLRAVENNMFVIRSANSGISGLIDNHGKVINKLRLGNKGIIDITI